ncbi:unnamed protein product [Calypogeia fissa]
MSLSSLADAPPILPPTRIKSPPKGVRRPNQASSKRTQRVSKSQTSIDALFSDGAEGTAKASPALPMEAKQAKGQPGEDPIADLFADEDVHIPGIRALTGDSGRKTEEPPPKPSAFSLGNEMLDADLRSLSHPASELERGSPRTPREEFLLDRQKRVTLVQQVGSLADVMKPSNNAPARSPPRTSKSRSKKLENRAPDKACF